MDVVHQSAVAAVLLQYLFTVGKRFLGLFDDHLDRIDAALNHIAFIAQFFALAVYDRVTDKGFDTLCGAGTDLILHGFQVIDGNGAQLDSLEFRQDVIAVNNIVVTNDGNLLVAVQYVL